MDKSKKVLLVFTVVAFAFLTAIAIQRHGITGIFLHQLENFAGLQVLTDLAIALILILVWLVKDARARGLNPAPWVVLTLLAGSFGPLLYLILRRSAAQESPVNN